MIVLNLGCGTEGARSWHPIQNAVNLDKSMGWRFEDGLHEYAGGTVSGITVSHSLMYVALSDWPAVFAEFARVLSDGGVIRITEDATDDTRSRTYKIGWHDHVTLTSAALVKAHLLAAGLEAHDVGSTETHFESDILLQDQHGGVPSVFYCEGVRAMRIFFEPHADDLALYGSFSVLHYRPQLVVTCVESSGDYGDTDVRHAETRDAMAILGADRCQQWRFASGSSAVEIAEQMRDVERHWRPSLVFAPNRKASHPDHVAVAEAAAEVFGVRLRTYHTYDANGKVRDGIEAPYEPVWIQSKLRALARYESQITHPRACEWFMSDLREYLGEP